MGGRKGLKASLSFRFRFGANEMRRNEMEREESETRRATPPPDADMARATSSSATSVSFHGYAYCLTSCRPFPNAKLPYNVRRIATFWQSLLLTYTGTVLYGIDSAMPTAPDPSAKRRRRAHVKSRNVCVECKKAHRKVQRHILVTRSLNYADAVAAV